MSAAAAWSILMVASAGGSLATSIPVLLGLQEPRVVRAIHAGCCAAFLVSFAAWALL